MIKVDGEDNVADILTKVLSVRKFQNYRHRLMSLGKRPAVASLGPVRVRFKR